MQEKQRPRSQDSRFRDWATENASAILGVIVLVLFIIAFAGYKLQDIKTANENADYAQRYLDRLHQDTELTAEEKEMWKPLLARLTLDSSPALEDNGYTETHRPTLISYFEEEKAIFEARAQESRESASSWFIVSLVIFLGVLRTLWVKYRILTSAH